MGHEGEKAERGYRAGYQRSYLNVKGSDWSRSGGGTAMLKQR